MPYILGVYADSKMSQISHLLQLFWIIREIVSIVDCTSYSCPSWPRHIIISKWHSLLNLLSWIMCISHTVDIVMSENSLCSIKKKLLKKKRSCSWWEGDSREREICISMADSCWCVEETNTIVWNNYLSIKKKSKEKNCSQTWPIISISPDILIFL